MQRTLATAMGRTAAVRSSLHLRPVAGPKCACVTPPSAPIPIHRTCPHLPQREMAHELRQRFCGPRSAAKPGGLPSRGTQGGARSGGSMARWNTPTVSTTTSNRANSPVCAGSQAQGGQVMALLDRLRLTPGTRSHQRTGDGRPSPRIRQSLPFDGKRMFSGGFKALVAMQRGCHLDVDGSLPGHNTCRPARPVPKIRIILVSLPGDVQDHPASCPAAISASLAMVFMLRAVPDFAAGIFRRESAMPSP